MSNRSDQAVPEARTTERFSGISVSPGQAMGTVYIYRDIWDKEDGEGNSDQSFRLEHELEILYSAISAVLDDLKLSEQSAKERLGAELAGIFEAQQAMLEDEQLMEEILGQISEEHVFASQAVRVVFRSWAKKFRELEVPMFSERADDVVDLGRRMLRSMAGYTSHSLESVPRGSVLVAQRILPSEVVFLDPECATAIVVEEGGPGSHCSLLARGLGIPEVARVKGILNSVKTGDEILVDGIKGEICLSPAPEESKEFRARLDSATLSVQAAQLEADKPALTREGKLVPVLANIAGQRDATTAIKNGADGVGLYRIESIYLRASHVPDEEELYQTLKDSLDPFRGKPVCVRLLDAGGDKEIPCLRLPVEAHPFLGRRGVRVLFDYPELLSSQLRALLRLKKIHDLRILIPMVTDLSDVTYVKGALRECCDTAETTDPPLLGAMIETPAAALFTHEICEEVDFVSIGTNDLTQYVMAAARGNSLVSRYYEDRHPAVMRMVRLICNGASSAGKPVSLCGTLASWENSIPELVEMGVTSLSVAPPLIPTVKEAVRTY